ncbi:TPA: hypothetical protein N0F65_009460 [Lagenidium giganteum]|uniref:Uncharacterized protein n=1 Tax=Lagenidium giganteum TaxID=4803 RepID=A0AAV2ZE25_9STRA|nr:TPA: hypothetical protein N0F65_009460 [Lagenidium giganteum]
MKIAQSPGPPAIATDIDAVKDRWIRHRSMIFDMGIPFSWLRFASSLMSIGLLCTDVVRSTPGIRSYKSIPGAVVIEPDTLETYGPWAYDVQMLSSEDKNDTVGIWSYKFDTTSISWRAFAQHLNVTSFPDCLHYNSDCTSATINQTIAFKMIDELVEQTVAYCSTEQQKRAAPSSITVRSEALLLAAGHHYLLTKLFVTPLRRTHQAVHFPASLVMRERSINVCAFRGFRPHFCHDLWQNFNRSSNTGWYSFGHIAKDIQSKLHELKTHNPGSVVDLTVLSSREDTMLNVGGLTQGACPKVDVSTVMRVRSCRNVLTADSCTTKLVRDHRYETDQCTSNATDWFPMVRAIRITAQVYFIARVLLLLWGCVLARSQEAAYENATWLALARAGLRTFARVPAQGIVYGSPLPILLYTIAYWIDTPIAYQIIANRMCDIDGNVVKLGLKELTWLMAVQMRNVWVLGLMLQLGVSLMSRRGWTPPQGIIGLPEFSLSSVSAFTALGQLQFHQLRDTRILNLFEIGSSPDRLAAMRAFGTPLLWGSVISEGVFVDTKMLLAMFCVVVGTYVVTRLALNSWVPMSRTFVPYSAGVLWPVVAFSVNWGADFFPVTEAPKLSRFSSGRSILSRFSSRFGSNHVQALTSSRTQSMMILKAKWPRNRKKRLEVAHLELSNVHARSDDGHGVVAMMNLFAMTDPLVWLRLRWIGGHRICYMRNKDTGAYCCLPYATYADRVDCEIPWYRMEVVAVKWSTEMTWSELLHCG